MKSATKFRRRRSSIAASIRSRIEAEGERVWREADFRGLCRGGSSSQSGQAVSQALSRLARQGVIQRVGKGLYYRGRDTAFGPSVPSPTAMQRLPIPGRAIFPAGLAAAGLLGFTTQQPAKAEIATTGTGLPRLIVGRQTIIRTRRPEAWRDLEPEEASLLDFLRQRGATSELSPADTVDRLLTLCKKPGRFTRLCKVAATEPPRCRAMLGAIGQQLGRPARQLETLRRSLNPLSRFDFGKLAALEHSRDWQAQGERGREAFRAP